MWQWTNWLHTFIPQGKTPLHVNLDETSIRLHSETGLGFLAAGTRQRKRSKGGFTRDVPKKMLRGSFCHMAVICDDPNIQKVLPQYIFVNAALISKADADLSAEATATSTLVIVRVKSTWTTTERFIHVLKNIVRRVKMNDDNKFVVFSADAYPAHVSPKVMLAASRLSIIYHVIPACMTWALQPCDTHVFGRYKDYLATTCQRICIDERTTACSGTQLLRAIAMSTTDVINATSWRTAFQQLGLTGDQLNVSERVLAKLHYSTRPSISDTMPTLSQLTSMFPRRTNLNLDAIFSCVVKQEQLARLHRADALVAGLRMNDARASQASGSTLPPPLPPPSSLPPCPPTSPLWRVRPLARPTTAAEPTNMVPRLKRLPSGRADPSVKQ